MAENRGLQRLVDSIDRLSTREKVMLGALLCALVLTFGVGLSWIAGRQIKTLEQRNESIRDSLAQVQIQKEVFLANRARLEAAKKKLDGNNLKLVQEMEKEALRLEIEIEDFKENKRFLTENHRRAAKRSEEGEAKKVKDLVEESQTVTIRKVSLEQLTEFLNALESRPEPVKVTQLTINTLASDRQTLREVRLTVSTYRNEEVEP